MDDSIHPKRLTGVPRARLLIVATLVSGFLIAGCGGGSASPTAATVTGGNPPAATVAAGGSTGTSSGSPGAGADSSGPLAFARCMRANGVPNFPDPVPGRGFLFPAGGVNPNAPAVAAAQAKCRKLMGGGPPGPGSTTHPSAQTLAKLRNIAQCMRQNGVPEFPDPRTSVPAHPFLSGEGVITDYDGAIMLFPSTLDMEAPAYTRAAAACGVLAGKLGRGPHS